MELSQLSYWQSESVAKILSRLPRTTPEAR